MWLCYGHSLLLSLPDRPPRGEPLALISEGMYQVHSKEWLRTRGHLQRRVFIRQKTLKTPVFRLLLPPDLHPQTSVGLMKAFEGDERRKSEQTKRY